MLLSISPLTLCRETSMEKCRESNFNGTGEEREKKIKMQALYQVLCCNTLYEVKHLYSKFLVMVVHLSNLIYSHYDMF